MLTFKKLAELPFDSNRKCMSVVIRETSVSGQESIYVLTKGAESAILPVSIQGPVDATKNAVDDFASAGLRTLVFAFKNITKEEFEDFAANLVSTLWNFFPVSLTTEKNAGVSVSGKPFCICLILPVLFPRQQHFGKLWPLLASMRLGYKALPVTNAPTLLLYWLLSQWRRQKVS